VGHKHDKDRIKACKNELGKYIFFVDINGHIEDEDVRDALTMVRRKTSFYKFLGFLSGI